MVYTLKERVRRYLDNQHDRHDWIKSKLAQIPPKHKILDAGCGSQIYREFCGHLEYVGQDFGKFETDEAKGFTAQHTAYEYGELDLVSDVWRIPVAGESFDAILCSEVFEHIPYPVDSVREFARILKPGGTLILTAPFACLRHMDPYFYYTGFSDRFYQRILPENGFEILEINHVGDYHKRMSVDLVRTWRQTRGFEKIYSAVVLLPAFILYFLKGRRPTEESIATLTMGYHVLARKSGTKSDRPPKT